MKNITVDFTKDCGKVKPMHAVNNGPCVSSGVHYFHFTDLLS